MIRQCLEKEIRVNVGGEKKERDGRDGKEKENFGITHSIYVCTSTQSHEQKTHIHSHTHHHHH